MNKKEFEANFHQMLMSREKEIRAGKPLTTKQLKTQQDEIDMIATIYKDIPCMTYNLRSVICLIEEISELITELMKSYNGDNNKITLLEEIADVIICTECVRTLTDQKMQSEQQTAPEHHIPVESIYTQSVVEPPRLTNGLNIKFLCFLQQQLTKYIRKNETDYYSLFKTLNGVMGVIKYLCTVNDLFTKEEVYAAVEVKIRRDIDRRDKR